MGSGSQDSNLCGFAWGDDRERPASCLPAKLEGVFFTLNSAEVDLGCEAGGEPCGRLCCTCGVVSSLRNLGFGWG